MDKALIKVVQETPKSEAKYAKTLVEYFKTKAKTQKELFTLNYLWVVMNIKYGKNNDSNPFDTNPQIRYETYITMKSRKAICAGFSTLLKQLCDFSNIKSEIVLGYAKSYTYSLDMEVIPQSNHQWNAIFLDNKWQLVDVTWDANFFDNQNEYFLKEGKLKYISMKPDTFLLTHFPDDKKWQLLKKPISEKQFLSDDWDYKNKLQSDLITKDFFDDRYIEDVERDPKLK